ncbi:hypothetical protein Acsp01_33310 [Actinoplanes sp. NBRC 101535]|nr:hypothetical protein Acsp01_33310 [Actinoplanes sp. NBRC 101535]
MVTVTQVLDRESQALTAALRSLPAGAWDRPTRCTPWRVRDLAGHIIAVVSRVPGMIAGPAPERADTDAARYYRGDERFSDSANEDRIALGRTIGGATPDELITELEKTCRQALDDARTQPPGRIVVTRHGDAMLLDEFLTTRVLEIAVHGLDIADAIPVPAWLTPAAAAHLQRLFPATAGAPDPAAALRAATGRALTTGTSGLTFG